ncbi:MAG: 30S ribosome-binding factor RbfA [Treponema sp.]|jgi:ribosome-binding factor A|nr:30S ribosome-binding factor RbfA [Treponema sp.]
MYEYRKERVGRLIQEKIGALIVEGKVKDPRVDPFLTITRVRVSRDFAYADCYVSSYKSAGLAAGVEGLRSAAGFIQSQLARTMRIRQTPRLRFHEDQGIREGFEMTRKIEDLARGAE